MAEQTASRGGLRPKNDSPLIECSASSPERWLLLPLKRFVGALRLLLSRREHPLFAAPDPLVGVKAFQHKLRRRYQCGWTVFCSYPEGRNFFHEALNPPQAIQNVLRAGRLGQPNFPTKIEPLHDLLHVHACEVCVVSLGDRGPNQLASDVVSTLHFAFVLKFQL